MIIIKKIIDRIEKRHLREVILYGMVGFAALATQTIVYLFLCRVQITPLLANLGGSLLGLLVGYYGHTRFTFQKTHHFSHQEFIKYIVTAVIGFVITSIGIYGLIHMLKLSSYFGVLPMFFTPAITFLISKFWAFK